MAVLCPLSTPYQIITPLVEIDETSVVPNSDPRQITTPPPLVLVGLGLGVREGLGVGLGLHC